MNRDRSGVFVGREEHITEKREMPMQIRREHRRRNTPHLSMVFDADTDQVLGRLVDITSGGMMLVVNSAIERYKEFHVRIVLPTMVSDRTNLELRARAAWCKKDDNPDYYKAGFEFLDIREEDENLIYSVMHAMNLVG